MPTSDEPPFYYDKDNYGLEVYADPEDVGHEVVIILPSYVCASPDVAIAFAKGILQVAEWVKREQTKINEGHPDGPTA